MDTTDFAQHIENVLHEHKRDHIALNPIIELLVFVDINHGTHADLDCAHQAIDMLDTMLTLGVDDNVLVATILYPFVQYAHLPIDSINTLCDQPVTSIMRDAQQIHDLGVFIKDTQVSSALSATQSENIRKMLLAMISDVRAVVIRIVEQLCILEHCKKQPPHIRAPYVEQTHKLYVPLANRLGLGELKWQLEDYVLRYDHPKVYRELSASLNEQRSKRDAFVNDFMQTLREKLSCDEITIHQISGRAKHIHSIYQKMLKKDKSFAEIYDVIAIRVIVQSIDQCYHALGIVNQNWQPIEAEFDDYIAAPKPNGYQSIHSAVLTDKNRTVEIQIRTQDMDQQAQYGIAAHWLYKESHTNTAQKSSWLNQLLAWQADLDPNPEGSTSMFADRVFVFTPNGDVKELVKGATPVDFAYSVHTEVGHHCSGAFINKKIVPLNTPLHNGDHVEIVTSKTSTPRRDWLDLDKSYVATSRARTKIQHWFRTEDEERYRKDGLEQLERMMKRHRKQNINLAYMAKQSGYLSVDLLYIALGRGEITADSLFKDPPKQQALSAYKLPRSSKPSSLITADGLEGILSFTARCCCPIPGDAIIGYITRGRGIAIHKPSCRNIIELSDTLRARCIQIAWTTHHDAVFPVSYTIATKNPDTFIIELTTWLLQNQILLQSLSNESDKQHLHITIELSNRTQAHKVLQGIQGLKSVLNVTNN